MCITPCNLPDGTQVACRYCWQCQRNRVNDLVGRCIAESKVSTKTLAITLTYSDEILKRETEETGENRQAHAAVLVYADFQKMVKRLRYAGYDVRYICAGEFGSNKGRAHWHAILFFKGSYPEVEKDFRVNWKYWPHGFAYFQEPEYEGFAYLLKYALKDQDLQVSVGHLAMSKKPPLGHDFFEALAEQYVAQGLVPRDPSYSFSHVFDKKRKRRRFWLQGRMREIFLDTFLDLWDRTHGAEKLVPSQFMEDYQDKVARAEMEAEAVGIGSKPRDEYEKFRMALATLWSHHEGVATPEVLADTRPKDPGAPSEVVKHIVCPEHDVLLTVYDDQTVDVFWRDEQWPAGSQKELVAALEVCRVPPGPAGQLARQALGSKAPSFKSSSTDGGKRDAKAPGRSVAETKSRKKAQAFSRTRPRSSSPLSGKSGKPQ